MTAVEWLEKEIKDTFYVAESSEMAKRFESIFEQAKQMEKQQIIDAANQIEFEDEDGFGISENITKGEQYYNETYGIVNN